MAAANGHSETLISFDALGIHLASKSPLINAFSRVNIRMHLDLSHDIHAQTTDALYAFMVDCHFEEAHLSSTALALALEYAYRPIPHFWQRFEIAHLVRALSRLRSDWRFTLIKATSEAEHLLRDMEELLRTKICDERNAEILLALPASERPSDADAAASWITHELARRGLSAEAQAAARDGAACGEHALELVRCLEHSDGERVPMTDGALAARAYRVAVMAR
jgi:hypothetical protein